MGFSKFRGFSSVGIRAKELRSNSYIFIVFLFLFEIFHSCSKDCQCNGAIILYGVGGYSPHGYEGREAIEGEGYR